VRTLSIPLRAALLTALGVLFMFVNPAAAQQPQAAPKPAPNDYAKGEAWLCRPGRQDACAVDNAATVVTAGGDLSREDWTADPEAPIDCFYVYPTVSTDPTPYADMNPDPAEFNVIRQQFARFASKCRPYAPLYRQVSLAGLRALLAGTGGRIDQGPQYDDVLDAFNYYLEHDNHGRGFVLIGHSQGSYILAELIRREIAGKPVAELMVSAILPGATIPIAAANDPGGEFFPIPTCRSENQIGCLVAYSAFRSTIPPPANTRFGRPAEAAAVAACTNPAALAESSAVLDAYLSTDGTMIVGKTAPKPWVVPGKEIRTPFVRVPGLLTAECKSNEYATYLEVTVHGDPLDPRVDEIVGDLSIGAQPATDWGLHLIDVNLAMGNLVKLVGTQAAAYLARRP